MTNEITILTKYISTWCWQILAIIFLCSSFILLALPKTLSSKVFSISFIIIFLVCEAIVIKRKKEFYDNK